MSTEATTPATPEASRVRSSSKPKTKTFAGRMDAKRLATVEAITQREAGMSFGQWCAELAEAIENKGSLPLVQIPTQSKEGVATLRAIREKYKNDPKFLALGKMSDEEIRKLIAKRYEA